MEKEKNWGGGGGKQTNKTKRIKKTKQKIEK